MKKELTIVFFLLLLGGIAVFFLQEKEESLEILPVAEEKKESFIEEKEEVSEQTGFIMDIVFDYDEESKAILLDGVIDGRLEEFSYELLLEDQEAPMKGSVPLALDEYGVFTQQIFLPATGSSTLTIRAFSSNQQNVFEKTFTIKEEEKYTVEVFFADADLYTQGMCEGVDVKKYTVSRKDQLEKQALNFLLAGDDAKWIEDTIPESVKIKSFEVQNGIAHVFLEVDEADILAMNACQKASMRKQISTTLLNMPSVNDVLLLLNGNPF